MNIAGRLLNPVSRLRRGLRFRLWVLRTRILLARHGCKLELVAPHGVSFHTPPGIHPTLRILGEDGPARGGRLRIELGEFVNLGHHVTVEVLPSGDNLLALGDGVVLGTGVRLALFDGQIRVGDGSTLRDGVMIKSSGRFSAGRFVEISGYTMIHCAEEVILEDHAGLAERVSVVDSDHPADGSDLPFLQQPLAVEPIHIERNVFVAANVVLLRGVRLGRNSVVAAGAVVRGGDYPGGWIIAGAPAEAKRALPAAGEPAERAT